MYKKTEQAKHSKPAFLIFFNWWRDPESNWGHKDFQSSALPTELSRQRIFLKWGNVISSQRFLDYLTYDSITHHIKWYFDQYQNKKQSKKIQYKQIVHAMLNNTSLGVKSGITFQLRLNKFQNFITRIMIIKISTQQPQESPK